MERKRSPDEIVLSFFDTMIYRRDLDLLHEKLWINDVLIGFFNEYLEKVVHSERRSEICLVHPDVVFACAALGDGCLAAELMEDLKLHEKNYVIFPCSDNDDPNAPGGTHWSIVAYNRIQNTFFYLDSVAGHNLKLSRYMSVIMASALGITDPPNFESLSVPQQKNGFDCGMYVICFTEAICISFLNEVPMDLIGITPEYVAAKRKSVYDLILHLREIF